MKKKPSVLSPEEFESMKKIGAIVANCLQYLKAQTRPGITTLELDHMAAQFLAEYGAISAPISTYQFPGTVCISVEHEAAHGIPGERVIEDGDLVNIDVSAHLDGWYADNGQSFVVGEGAPIKHTLCSVAEEALDVALSKAVAGNRISELGRAIENLVRPKKLSVIQNLGGHGVGRSLHEPPEFIPSFFDRRDRRVLKEHTIIAVEPFISNGARSVQEASDEWTLYHPKCYIAQREHTVMITKKEPIIFTIPTKEYTLGSSF